MQSTSPFNMFKIGLENRDFCKSLHFYIVDAGKKKKKKKKKKKRAASAGLFSCYRHFGPRTSPFGRCPHYLFFLCCGALASALIYTHKRNTGCSLSEIERGTVSE